MTYAWPPTTLPQQQVAAPPPRFTPPLPPWALEEQARRANLTPAAEANGAGSEMSPVKPEGTPQSWRLSDRYDPDAPRAGRNKLGQFEKGFSGCIEGRRPKRQRSYTEREFHRDVLAATEQEILMEDGSRVPAITLVFQELVKRAREGNRLAINMVAEYHLRAYKFFEERNCMTNELEEWHEDRLGGLGPLENDELHLLNEASAISRKT